jgi:hypothetical protein
VHISKRVVQNCLCDNVLVPLLSNQLIHDNGASVKGKGVHFALRRLIVHMGRFYRSNGFSNSGDGKSLGLGSQVSQICAVFIPAAPAIRNGKRIKCGAFYSHCLPIKKQHDKIVMLFPYRSLHKRKTQDQILRALHGRYVSDTRKPGIPAGMP